MRGVSVVVDLAYDDEARVWVATSNDISGLAVEGGDVDAVTQNVLAAIPILIELNGLPEPSRLRPFARLRRAFRRRRVDARRAVDVAVDIRQHAILRGVPAPC